MIAFFNISLSVNNIQSWPWALFSIVGPLKWQDQENGFYYYYLFLITLFDIIISSGDSLQRSSNLICFLHEISTSNNRHVRKVFYSTYKPFSRDWIQLKLFTKLCEPEAKILGFDAYISWAERAFRTSLLYDINFKFKFSNHTS